jgi:membrane protein implicated in regulation of membrane protease activity
MGASTLWWLLLVALVVLELLTGTFYLLMLALGAGAAALVAHTGAGFNAQVLTAAVVGGGATVLWHLKRGKPTAHSARDMNLDIGETVQVAQWSEIGEALVQFRGSTWQAKAEAPKSCLAGPHEIVGLDGNRLVLRRKS